MKNLVAVVNVSVCPLKSGSRGNSRTIHASLVKYGMLQGDNVLSRFCHRMTIFVAIATEIV